MQAGFLSVKLKYLDKWNQERIRIAPIYNERIKNSRRILPCEDSLLEERNVFHIYPIPIPEQEAYSEYRDMARDIPNIKRICKEEISIPLYPGMTEQKIERVIEVVNNYGKE